ncbi:MAG: hypothetical protein EPO24_14675 [Bacteroidetes bacterium]|nr:MAG: hypothetical protein EPO24_14675 [Bacteroidota bacterium]
MEPESIYYRRRLPRYQPANATYFITFRLAGSLPRHIIAELKAERDSEERLFLKQPVLPDKPVKRYEMQKRYFGKFDALLDSGKTGPLWLGNSSVADLVAEAIRYRDGKMYDLIAYCIMPNHVHLVFSLLPSVVRPGWSHYVVTNILENLKWYTALKSNQILNRSGAFWQHESYDHVVRDGKELLRIIS